MGQQLRKGLKRVGFVLFFFFFAYGVASFLNDYIVQYEEIQGSSMEPLLADGEHVFISPLPFWLETPQRFDVIAFERARQLYVKRVIALPGETVSIKNGNIYLNGQVLTENYGKDEIAEDMEPVELGEGEYFVLGDNRNYSTDSRAENIGMVKQEQVKGKVLFR